MRIRKSCDGVLRPRERLEVRIIAIYSSPKTAKNAKKKLWCAHIVAWVSNTEIRCKLEQTYAKSEERFRVGYSYQVRFFSKQSRKTQASVLASTSEECKHYIWNCKYERDYKHMMSGIANSSGGFLVEFEQVNESPVGKTVPVDIFWPKWNTFQPNRKTWRPKRFHPNGISLPSH